MATISTYRRIYGQFFTPEPVVACCYALLVGALPPAPRIVDPACGDGAFLRYAVAHGLTAGENLYGCDVDAGLVGQLRAGGLANVRCADGLDAASLPEAWFDLVIGNPPFGVTPGPHPTPLPAGGEGRAGRARRARYSSEVCFLLRALQLARPGGYVALVLPSGVLANERLRAVRAGLVERCTVLAVIALPRDTFRSAGTSAACSVVLLRVEAPPPGHRVFFGLAAHLDDLPALVAAYLPSRPHPAPVPPPRQRRGGQEEGWRGAGGGVAYWLPQTAALAQRMDAHFWRPDERLLLERIGARYPLRPLGELLEKRRNLIAGDHVRPSRGEAKGPGLPYEYYQTREFMAAGYNYARLERCDERAYRRLRHTAVQQYDILVSCAGVGGAGQGRVCLVTHRPGPSCTGDVFILRVREPDPVALFLFLSSRAGRAQLLRLQNGVGTANLSTDELLQVQVPLLPLAMQRNLAARYAPIAAAHDRAMAALAGGDLAGFERERAWSEVHLTELKRAYEEAIGLSGG